MNRFTFAGLVALLVAGLSAPSAGAQVAAPRPGALPAGPTVSPYLNFLRNPNAPTLNYYGLVRPQFQTNAGLQLLQTQFAQSQRAPLAGEAAPDDVLVTGHAAVFMNTGGYFLSPVGAARPAPVGAAGPRPGLTSVIPRTRQPAGGSR